MSRGQFEAAGRSTNADANAGTLQVDERDASGGGGWVWRTLGGVAVTAAVLLSAADDAQGDDDIIEDDCVYINGNVGPVSIVSVPCSS